MAIERGKHKRTVGKGGGPVGRPGPQHGNQRSNSQPITNIRPSGGNGPSMGNRPAQPGRLPVSGNRPRKPSWQGRRRLTGPSWRDRKGRGKPGSNITQSAPFATE